MSRKTLEQILEHLLSDDTTKAEELLHEYVVEKARSEYTRVLDESDEEWLDEEDVDDMEEEIDHDEIGEAEEDDDMEVIDQADDFEDEMAADDEAGMDAEMDMDDEMDSDEDADLEDKVDELEAELEDLKAEFEALMSDEGEEEVGGEDDVDDIEDIEDEIDADEEGEMESVEYDLEESFVSDNSSAEKPDMSGDEDASSKESSLTKAPKKEVDKAKPVKNHDGSDGKAAASTKAKDETPTDNVDVKSEKASVKKS